jgi:hypothetical protein
MAAMRCVIRKTARARATRNAGTGTCTAIRTATRTGIRTGIRTGAVLALAMLLLPSCTYLQGDDRVFVASEPAGARIYVDGMDIGHTTPYQFNLANWGSHDHTITVAKKGYTVPWRT